MKYKKIHFMYEPKKEPAASFAEGLIDSLGQATMEEADVVVTIGGDGLLLKALRTAGKTPVYAVTPPGSNSNGFWTDHDVDGPAKLLENLERASGISLAPLEAEITFSDGHKTTCYAFNEVAIERGSGQSALINLTAKFSEAVLGPYRIMGDGFIFSTALGSTGTGRAYNGPSVDIHNNVMILIGKGIYQPVGMVPLVAEGQNTSFTCNFGTVDTKRPVRIDFDGLSIEKDEHDSRVDGLSVSPAPEKAATLLVTKEPGTRAFSSMMPRP